ALERLAGDFGRVERGTKPLLVAEITRTFPETRAADSGRAVPADQLAIRVLAQHFVDEDVLRDDDVAFHPHHFGDVRDAARAVTQARRLDHDVDRRADHLANCF